MPAVALAVLDEPTTKLATIPTSDQLDHQLKLLFEEISDRVDRVRHRLDSGESQDRVLDDLTHLLMAASMTSPANPMWALATEAATALLYAARQSAEGASR